MVGCTGDLKKYFILLLYFCLTLLLLFLGCLGSANIISVEYIVPEGLTKRGTNITIQFSEPMVDESLVGKFLDSAAVIIEPQIQGRYQWIDAQTLQLMPERLLAPSTEYSLKILPDILPSPEKKLKKPRKFNFHTPRIRISNFVPLIKPLPEDPSFAVATIQIRFSEEISVEDFKQYVSLELKDGDFAGEVSWETKVTEPSTVFSLQTDAISRSEGVDNTMIFTINKDLKPVDGALSLSENYIKNINVSGRRKMNIRRIEARQSGKNLVIVIDMSTPVHIASAKEYIRISPGIEFDISQDRAGRIKLIGDFEPEKEYLVTLFKGLRSMDGVNLLEDFMQQVTIPSYSPSINFTSHGTYLSKNGLKNVELETINQENVHIEVKKIYINNLVPYLHSKQNKRGYSRRYAKVYPLGHRIYEVDKAMKTEKNVYNNATINFEPFLKDHQFGLFQLTIRGKSRYWRADSKSVMITDIGLIAKRIEDELHVWALSTESLDPLQGIEIKLLSTSNQAINQSFTDQNGKVILRGISRSTTEFVPFVITAEKGNDFSYLLFSESMVLKSHLEIDGYPTLKKGHEAFIYVCPAWSGRLILLIHPDLGEVKPIGKGVAGNGRV
ncbi:MAG: hypothetical protein P9L92_06940 [Candidatus Electryonea clarkiae]|nr:hypothetical protein [Candidatus Electryonea clarkiae]